MINKICRDRLSSLKSVSKYMVLEERLPLENCTTDTDLKNRDVL